MRKAKPLVARCMLVTIGILSLALQSCSKKDNPVAAASSSGPPVALAVSFSKPAIPAPIATTSGLIDSIRIDSAVVVVENVTLLSGRSSSGHDGHGEGRDEAGLTFQGPFVIWVRDSLGIDLANQIVPAGTYTGIKFDTHSLRTGEHHEDGDDHRHENRLSHDSVVTGSSVMVWGAVLKGGEWVPFSLNTGLETEIEIHGNFEVPETAGTVKIALHFNLGLLFKDPMTGTFFDPTDPSIRTKELLALAIQNAFGEGRGGHDHDGDGHPDD